MSKDETSTPTLFGSAENSDVKNKAINVDENNKKGNMITSVVDYDNKIKEDISWIEDDIMAREKTSIEEDKQIK